MSAYDFLEHLRPSAGPSVLATVTAVEGHAYRKEGAAMVLRPSGAGEGIISPGCLEDDLAARVPGVLASGLPTFVEYDMRPEEDAIWGEAIGCGGRITVLLEPLSGALLERLLEARERLSAGEGVVLERRLQSGRMAYRLIPMPSDAGFALPAGTGEAASAGEDEWRHLSAFRPRPRLIVFGAGRDTPQLCALASRIGFRVVMADWRAELLTPDRYPQAAERVVGAPDELAAALRVGAADYVVICSHQMRRDRDMLERLLPAGPAYLGVMGSRKRIALLFEGLERTPNVRAPIGLDIGADGPDEIAVSIAAELVSVRAAAAAGKGARLHADRRLVFGRGAGQPDGRAQAVR